MTPALDERRTADGRRRINLTRREREALVQRERVEAAVALFLDISVHRTTQEIAEELGISRKALKTLTKREDFIALYNDHFIELGHDPRLQAIRAGISDLLPHALEQLSKLLVNADTPPSVKRKLGMDILELCGVKPQDPKGSNKRELATFLKEQGATINLNQFNFNVPQQYDEALDDIIEGVIEDIEPTPLVELGDVQGAAQEPATEPDQPDDATP